MKTIKYVPILNEQEIVSEIERRINQLEGERDEQPGKDMWIAWGESDNGMELESLLKMLNASELYCGVEMSDKQRKRELWEQFEKLLPALIREFYYAEIDKAVKIAEMEFIEEMRRKYYESK